MILGLFFPLLFALCAESNDPNPTPSQPALLDFVLSFARQHREFNMLEFPQDEDQFVNLVQKRQSPKILFIGCSDSRVIPDLILSTNPGDLFVIRTAGNFVTPYRFQYIDGVAATLQYAVEVLKVSHVIVCGHSHCGAIQGLFKELPEDLEILKHWLKLGEMAKLITLKNVTPLTTQDEIYTTTTEMSVVFQLEHLLTYPFVKNRVKEGKLQIHGWYFKIESGELWYYNTKKYQFLRLINKPSTPKL